MGLSFSFVEYRYPENPYDEVLYFEEKVSKNNPSFDCGWVSPDGDTYWCEPRCHSDLADIISDELYDGHNGERILEEKGWIKVYHESEYDDCSMFAPEGIFYTNNNLPTEKQITVVKKLGRFTEEFKDFLRMNKKYSN